MSYVCRCNNGHRPAANSGCDKANCRNCCKGKGGVNPDSSEWGRGRIQSTIGCITKRI